MEQKSINITILSTMIAQQEQPQRSSHITARMFDFINIEPSRIQHLCYSSASNKLYVSRKTCTEVYSVLLSDNIKEVSIQQIMLFEPCDRIYEIDGLMVLIFPFQLKINNLGKWVVHPFTTQTLPVSARFNSKNNRLYTFHVNQCRQWTISQQQGVSIRYLPKNQTPYHVNADGLLEGFGKKIKPNNTKHNNFTILEESQCRSYLFLGTNNGQLHIYETKFLTHVKTFHRHEGAILTIKAKENICYFSGSDSKVSSVVYIKSQSQQKGAWTLSKQTRGQSHDIMSLQMINQQYLISGGITTDICFYKLTEAGLLTNEWCNKVCYSNQKLISYLNNYIIVNKYTSFQIWRVAQIQDEQQSQLKSKSNVQLTVQYQMPFYKSIRHILSKIDEKNLILFVSTQEQASLFQFSEQKGLVKLLTVKNSYNLVCWYKKQYLLTIRDGNKLELFNFKNGSIKQIAQVDLQYATDLMVNSASQDRILVGSKYSERIQIYQMDVHKGNSKKYIQLDLATSYEFVDFCYYNPLSLIIKYANNPIVYEINRKGNVINEVIKLPITKIRMVGWLPYSLKQKRKLFWYAVGQGKIVIVSRMKTFSKDRKIRVKQMPRIGNVIINSHESHSTWNIGVIPLDFGKLISRQIKPIITKKIL